MTTLLKPSLDDLVNKIIAVNQAWKLAITMFNNDHPLAQSLRDLKTRLQVRLLRTYAPKFVYLLEDQETESEEPLYSLKLVSPINNYHDAAHIPIRVAQDILTAQEISQFSLSS